VTGEWLTYAQIGERFGLKAEAARTRVRRLGWRTMPGNDGRTLALVPEDADLRPGGAHAVPPEDDRVDSESNDRPVTAMLTGLLTEATARADRAEERADEAGKRVEAALGLADRTLARLADADARADKLRTLLMEAEAQRDTARGEATAAKEAAEAERDRIAGELAQAVERRTAAEAEARLLREAENARQQLGRWRRAWRGWRGR
jgi:hypothetical protein